MGSTHMTLNLTALSANFVAQVSDRRLTHVSTSGSISIDDDDANKAVVLSCSDSLLAITFTGLGKLETTAGLGKLNTIRVDEWLVDVLQREALCELECDVAVQKFSRLATEWFRSIRSSWSGPHNFIFAGFQKRSNTKQFQARVWFVTNSESSDYSNFEVRSFNKFGTYVTGWLSAFTRAERKRVEAAFRTAKNFEQIETALINGIRNAASRPNGKPIGKSCMSISLAPPMTAVSRFHPEKGHAHNFAPHVVWYEGGRNYAVKGIDHLTEGRYSLVFGGNTCNVAVRHGTVITPPPVHEINPKFEFRFTDAQYHSEPVTESTIVKIVAD